MGLLSHPRKIRRFWRDIPSRRLDIAHVGDSNIMYSGHGWQWGYIYALGQRFGTSRMYAGAVTDFMGGGANWGGYDEGTFSDISFENGTHNLATSGAAAYFNTRMSPSVSDHPVRYGYMADDSGIDTEYGAGTYFARFVGAGHYCNPASTACRWHLMYGTSASSSSGLHQFRPCAFTNGGTLITAGNEIDPVTGADGTAWTSLDYTTPATTAERRLFPTRWLGGTADDRTIGGPMYFYWNRIEVPARTSGWSSHVLISMGSRALRDHAIGLGATDGESSRVGQDIEQLKLHIEAIVRLQTWPKTLMVRTSSGFNDANTATGTSPGVYLSVGGAGLATSTPGGYFDNLKAIRTRLLLAWEGLGYDPRNLFMLIARSHSVTSLDTTLRRYHGAASDFAATYDNVCALDTGAIINQVDIDRLNLDSDGGGAEHLKRLGYQYIASAEVEAISRETGRMGTRPIGMLRA